MSDLREIIKSSKMNIHTYMHTHTPTHAHVYSLALKFTQASFKHTNDMQLLKHAHSLKQACTTA